MANNIWEIYRGIRRVIPEVSGSQWIICESDCRFSLKHERVRRDVFGCPEILTAALKQVLQLSIGVVYDDEAAAEYLQSVAGVKLEEPESDAAVPNWSVGINCAGQREAF